MKLLLYLFLATGISFNTMAQVSDILVVKKRNGRILKTYTKGSFINFYARNFSAPIEGEIAFLQNDSIFIKNYLLKVVNGVEGGRYIDTIEVFVSGFYFKEISRVKIKKSSYVKNLFISKLLMYGGAGTLALNFINGNFKSNNISRASKNRVIFSSLGALATGFAISRIWKKPEYSKKSARFIYYKNS
jgi:hypothetical protein